LQVNFSTATYAQRSDASASLKILHLKYISDFVTATYAAVKLLLSAHDIIFFRVLI